jgi:SNF2 family DNA or RNA helicase
MRVLLESGNFILTTNYEEKFKAQACGGKWEAERRVWTVKASLLSALGLLTQAKPGDDVEAARAFLREWEKPVQLVVPSTKEALMPHQVRGASEIIGRGRYFITFDMGTGKTATVIGAAQELFKEKKVDLALIVAPLSVFGSWVRQVARFCAVPYRFMILAGARKERLSLMGDIKTLRGALPWKRLVFACVNYEALRLYADDLIKLKPGLVAFDESTFIKNRSAQMTKAAARVSRAARYATALTGTPISNNVGDLFGQLHAVSSDFVGDDYWHYIREFATFGGYKGKEIVGSRNLNALDWILKRCSYRVRKDEVIQLPSLTQETRDIELSGDQEEAYEKAANDFYFAVEAVKKTLRELDRRDDPEKRRELVTVLIKNAMSRLLRCQQIAGGHCKSEVGDTIYWPENPKCQELVEIAQESNDQRIVVFSRFIEDLEQGRKALEKAGFPCEVKHDERARIENEFLKDVSRTKAVFVQVKTGGFGIDFSKASIAVFYNNWFSWAVRDQAQSRLHRLGQTRNVLCIDLIAKGTVDETILETVLSKRSLSEVLFGKKVEAADEYENSLPVENIDALVKGV